MAHPGYDYHTHTTYSDGSLPVMMLEAAADAGLAGVGFADHCNVSAREAQEDAKCAFGYNLDLTYERRRRGIEALRERWDLRIFDAVEMDYFSDEERRIAAFLDEAAFDYAVGSVHEVAGANVHDVSAFADRPERERHAAVDGYFEDLCALADSELFDIAAHPDIVERNAALRGLATEDHYAMAADAFAASRTVPEINAGRVFDDYGQPHPHPSFLDVLVERGVEVTVGSDSHAPDQLRERTDYLREFFAERGVEAVPIHERVER